MEQYSPEQIEKKWQQHWEEKQFFAASEDSEKEKWYTLVEFPYPSGAGLHNGHVRPYTALDVVSRKKRMQGYNVLLPIGYDAFGLPTENYAIKTGRKPQEVTAENVQTFRRQLQSLGLSFDWNREVNTTDPEYYKWTQWQFNQLFKHGLAYKKEIPINWCLSCKIGLANEEVVEGKCERCGGEVEKRNKEQWMIAITKYADRLLEDLDTVDYLPKIRKQQEDWIGKSLGAEIEFQVTTSQGGVTPYIRTFTTRPDTLFGATYMVLAPEHELVDQITTEEQMDAVHEYKKQAAAKSDIERGDVSKEKTGVFTGAFVINPVNDEQIPVWIADYVLLGYGTGAIMAVPGHDERDFEFAKKYELPIRIVVKHPEEFSDINQEKQKELLKEVFQLAEQKDIKLTLIGGYAKTLLNEQEDQIHSDIDLFTTKDGFAELEEFFTQKGFKKKDPDEEYHWKDACAFYADDHWVDVFIMEEDHGEYFDTVCGRKFIWGSEDDFEEMKLDETSVCTPSSELLEKIYQNLASAVDLCFTGDGIAVNSGFLNGLSTKEATESIIQWLEKEKHGKAAVNYKLRDWVFSRQRYWGEPIPLVYCEECAKKNIADIENEGSKMNQGWVPVPDDQLPVELPDVDNYEPTDSGESPLADITNWVQTTCPDCGGPATRETDTMPNWAGSNWYFLRYTDPKNSSELASKERLEYWMPVDVYNGGMEHTTLHLLYSRFWHKFLYDIGVVLQPEPYSRRRSHGMVLASDGKKMSKSLGNVINPDDIIKELGADTLRIYEMFMGPFDEAINWDENGVRGCRKFLDRIWRVQEKVGDGQSDELTRVTHQTVRKITTDIDAMKFNTAVAQLMSCLNAYEKTESVPMESFETYCVLLSVFAPHIAEEIWEQLGHDQSITQEPWPEWDEELAKEETITIAVQVNGKVRDTVEVQADAEEADVKQAVEASEKVQRHLKGSTIKKEIYVPGKIYNIVIT